MLGFSRAVADHPIRTRGWLRSAKSAKRGHGFTRRRVKLDRPTLARLLSATTGSPCAARCRRQSMTARLPLHPTRSCTLPGLAASGCWRCGTLAGLKSGRKVGDRDALIDQLWSAIQALPYPVEPNRTSKPPSKQEVVIAMLRLPEGATVRQRGGERDRLAGNDTVRGVFSGALKKKLRHPSSASANRSAAGCTVSPSRRAHENPTPRRFGSPALWAEPLGRKPRPEGPAARFGIGSG